MRDFHTHSNYSDGLFPPRELVALAAREGVQELSLTDHDALAGVLEARASASSHGIGFLPGLEITTRFDEGVIHMLGEESLFTRPSIEHAIEHMDQILETDAVDVDELRTALWMSGFRATVDSHGDVVHVCIPGLEEEPPD